MTAFREIYISAFDFISRVAYRMVDSREDAEDITQEVFVTVYRNLDRFRFESSLTTWLYRIAVNTSLNHIQKRKRQGAHVPLSDTHAATPAPLPSEDALDPQTVAAMLEQINPDQRACLILRSMEGLSYQEIAETLQIPVNTVRTRIKRGREAMMALRKEALK
jgi:RNA polymerase sigma-70 factor (ECF subfamily)